ncbi:hypothetical protein HDU79_009841 [Rhizoclosmatium sp. JEL0117]|nr:hypothetical protein HDU79_009841 [Rhizoclosmatium sp. JEL0117]
MTTPSEPSQNPSEVGDHVSINDEGEDEIDDYGDDEATARNLFLERQALRNQTHWAYNEQAGTQVYIPYQEEYKAWCAANEYPDVFVS